MDFLIVPDDSSREIIVLFRAVVDEMFVGIAQNQSTGKQFPTIDLFYPARLLRAVLKIVNEMEASKCFPEVYVEKQESLVNIAVIFKLKPASSELIRGMLPKEQAGEFKAMIAGKDMTLIMTGETELEDIDAFLFLFEVEKEFRLNIVRRKNAHEVQPLWGVNLTSLKSGFPKSIP